MNQTDSAASFTDNNDITDEQATITVNYERAAFTIEADALSIAFAC